MSRQETKQGNIVKGNYDIVLPFSRQTVQFIFSSPDGIEQHYDPPHRHHHGLNERKQDDIVEERTLLDDIMPSGREIMGPVVSWIDNTYESTKYKIKGYLPKKTKTYKKKRPTSYYNTPTQYKPADYKAPDYRPAPPNYYPPAADPYRPEVNYNRPPEYEPNYPPPADLYRPEGDYKHSKPPEPTVQHPEEDYKQDGQNYNDWKPSMDAFGAQPEDFVKIPIEYDPPPPHQVYQGEEFENNYNGWKPSADAFGGPIFWGDTLKFNLDNLQNIYINELSNLSPYQY